MKELENYSDDRYESYEQYYSSEMAIEQNFLDEAYEIVDLLKNKYRTHQRQIHKKGAKGTHQERTERDAFSSHYGDEASRLEQIHDKLVFGKLYMTNGSIYRVGRMGLINCK